MDYPKCPVQTNSHSEDSTLYTHNRAEFSKDLKNEIAKDLLRVPFACASCLAAGGKQVGRPIQWPPPDNVTATTATLKY